MAALILMCLLVCPWATGAETLELRASAAHASEPLAMRVYAVERDGTTRAHPWPRADQIAWLYVRVGGTQENRDSSNIGEVDGDGARRVMAGAPGAALVGVDLKPTREVWSAEQAHAFAALCGKADNCFKDSVTVSHAVSAATVTNVAGEAGVPVIDEAPLSKSGQQTEIRPLMHPTKVRGGVLAVRVYVGGESIPGAQVRAVHIRSGAVQEVQADGKGIASVRIDEAGGWRLEFHTMFQVGEGWQATSCTLTFDALGAERVDPPASAGVEVRP